MPNSARTARTARCCFDPHADPLEMKNLVSDEKYKSVVAELSALTRQYAATLG